MKEKSPKTLLRWLGVLLASHFVANLLFSLIFFRIIVQMWEDYPDTGNRTLFFFGAAIYLIIAIFNARVESSSYEYQDGLHEAMEQPEFSLITYYKRNLLKNKLEPIVLSALLQLPLVISYALIGLKLDELTKLERFYIMDAGTYAVTHNPILGLLLNILVFAALLILTSFIALVSAKRDWEQY